MERWATIKEYPNYSVSDEGRVKNISTERILKQGKNPKGYNIVSLYREGKCSTQKVHRLVAEEFCKKNKNKKQINHIDGNKNNNLYSNLEWCTASENVNHAYKHGLRIPPRMKPVKLVETGYIYDSYSNCARAINGTANGIYDCIRGKQATHRGYHFEEVSV